MELFVTVVSSFWLWTIFVKLSNLDVYGSPRCPSIWWLNVTKSSVLDLPQILGQSMSPMQWSSFSLCLYSIQNSCLGNQYNGLPFQNIQTQGYLVKEPHLVEAVILNPRSFKFVWGKGLTKASPWNLSKSGRLTENRCLRVKLCMRVFPILERP